MTRPPLPPTAPPRAPREEEYGDGYVAANRRHENGFAPEVGADGNVVGGHLLRRDDECEAFYKTAQRTRDSYPVDQSTIEMGGWPADENGRGLTRLEIQALGSVSTDSEIEALPQENAA